jgi:hypothetical protein
VLRRAPLICNRFSHRVARPRTRHEALLRRGDVHRGGIKGAGQSRSAATAPPRLCHRALQIKQSRRLAALQPIVSLSAQTIGSGHLPIIILSIFH